MKRKVGGRTVTETRLSVRVRYTGPDGKRRAKWRRVENRTEAKTVLLDLAREVRDASAAPEAEPDKTFGDLATHYAATALQPAEYRDGRKVSGRRSLKGVHAQLRALCDFFGARAVPDEENVWQGGLMLRLVTHQHLEELRRQLFASPVGVTGGNPLGRPRKVATVDRYLQLLRHMLNAAVGRRWLTRNPFKDSPDGKPLISLADETQRRRILSFDEEDRLLAECVVEERTNKNGVKYFVRREHLRGILICALDTAMRKAEILKLRWRDVDAMSAGGRRLTIQQLNTKTLRERGAPVSRRFMEELTRLRDELGPRPEDRVFGITTDIKKSFAGACRDAGIKDLRFHDLRRTAATRLHREGMPLGELRHILGHADIKTTSRYIGVDEDTVGRAADIFDLIEEKRRKGRSAA